jgi:iron complex transport system substrate-binding protein
VAGLEPDAVVLAPCGFDLDRTLSEVVPLDLSAHLLGTAARQESRVFAVDANAMFSRPSPRVVDGVEVLAHLLHPAEYPDPGAPWSRIRL